MKQLLVFTALCGAAFVAVPGTARADHLYGGYYGGGYGGGYGSYGPGFGSYHNCRPFSGYHVPRLNGGYYGGIPYGSFNPYSYSYYGNPYLYPGPGIQVYAPGFQFGYYR